MYIIVLAMNSTDARLLVDIVKKSKHKALSTILSSSNSKNSTLDATLTTEIKKADALVVEASESNFELGRFITLGLQQHKPVLMLQKKKKEAPLLIGSSRLVALVAYSPDKKVELKNLLQKFFETAKKQRLLYRFNFMMSREMNDFLGVKAASAGISKADYIRNLVIEEMER